METYGEYLSKIEGQYISRPETEKATIALFYKISELVISINNLEKESRRIK